MLHLVADYCYTMVMSFCFIELKDASKYSLLLVKQRSV